MAANRRLKFPTATKYSYSSVTNSFTSIGAPACTGRGIIMIITSSLNSDSWLSFDAGTTQSLWLPGGMSLTLDFSSNDGEWSSTSTTVQIKYDTAAPTAGNIAVTYARVE